MKTLNVNPRFYNLIGFRRNEIIDRRICVRITRSLNASHVRLIGSCINAREWNSKKKKKKNRRMFRAIHRSLTRFSRVMFHAVIVVRPCSCVTRTHNARHLYNMRAGHGLKKQNTRGRKRDERTLAEGTQEPTYFYQAMAAHTRSELSNEKIGTSACQP